MISVIIATKNGAKHVCGAIQNALDQTVAKDLVRFQGFEIIVISDGSTDETVSLVKSTFPTTLFPNVRVLELKENVGPGLARKAGIELSANKYIAVLDDDDRWINPKKLENQVIFLEKNPNVLVVGAQKTEFITEEGKHILWYFNNTDPKVLRNLMLARNPIVNSSVVYRKEAYDKVGGYKDLRLSEDYDLWLRLGLIGDIANIEGAETAYTLRKNSTSGSNGSQSALVAKTVLKQIKEYKGKYPNYWIAAAKGYARLLLQSTTGVSFFAKVYANLKLVLGLNPKTTK